MCRLHAPPLPLAVGSSASLKPRRSGTATMRAVEPASPRQNGDGNILSAANLTVSLVVS